VIPGYAHDIHIGTPDFMNIAELFYDVFLSMDAGRRITGTAATRPESVRGLGDYSATFHQSGHMNAGEMRVAQIDSTTITNNLF